MNSYAIYNGEKIINVVVAKNIDDIVIEPETEIIECNNGIPWIDWTKFNNSWRPPQPFPSWTWNNIDWTPPVQKPIDNRYIWEWNEENLSWTRISLPQPYPSWTLNVDGIWIPPVPEPESDGFSVYSWNEELQLWELIPD